MIMRRALVTRLTLDADAEGILAGRSQLAHVHCGKMSYKWFHLVDMHSQAVLVGA